MSGQHVADRAWRGLGRAALAMGEWCDAYRPEAPGPAMAAEARFLRLPASFGPPSPRAHVPGYGEALWWGTFDAAYTRVGDYIRRDDGAVWFIGSQEKLMPVLCVRCERMLDVGRPAGATRLGVNAYGGVAKAELVPVLSGFPAAVNGAGGSGAPDGGLPTDVPAGSWQVLLPAVPGVVLRGGDIVSDELGRGAVVATAELTRLGWRLVARQAAT